MCTFLAYYYVAFNKRTDKYKIIIIIIIIVIIIIIIIIIKTTIIISLLERDTPVIMGSTRFSNNVIHL